MQFNPKWAAQATLRKSAIKRVKEVNKPQRISRRRTKTVVFAHSIAGINLGI